MMTRKHYVEFVNALGNKFRLNAASSPSGYDNGFFDAVVAIADVLKADNPRFRYDVFDEALVHKIESGHDVHVGQKKFGEHNPFKCPECLRPVEEVLKAIRHDVR